MRQAESSQPTNRCDIVSRSLSYSENSYARENRSTRGTGYSWNYSDNQCSRNWKEFLMITLQNASGGNPTPRGRSSLENSLWQDPAYLLGKPVACITFSLTLNELLEPALCSPNIRVSISSKSRMLPHRNPHFLQSH